MSIPLIHIVSLPTNDLVKVLQKNGIAYQLHTTQRSAINAAKLGDALLLLSETYPETPTRVDSDLLDVAAEKQLKVFIEFADAIPGLPAGAPRRTHWERAVVTTDTFGDSVQRNRILAIHGCHFIPMEMQNPLISLGRVAGFDKAVYGPARDSKPVIGIHRLPNGLSVMLASTKLSSFVRARYAPTDAWSAIWTYILRWLAPSSDIKQITWDAAVRPMYTKTAALPPNAEVAALRLAGHDPMARYASDDALRAATAQVTALQSLAAQAGLAHLHEQLWALIKAEAQVAEREVVAA